MDTASQADLIFPEARSTPGENGLQSSLHRCDGGLIRPEIGTGAGSRRSIGGAGFSLLEILVVLLVMGIITAMALPSAFNAIKGYRLHADATAVSSYLNVTRMKAASQYAPYRLVVDPTVTPNTYVMEKLCGDTPSTAPGDPSMNPKFDTKCTGPYQSFTAPQLEGGSQYISQGNTFRICRPASITGSQYPGTIVGNPATCTGLLYMYFNTRGSPVDNTGNPLGNGGAVLYIKSANGLIDAVTVSLGGQVATYMWDGAGWGLR
ncbi:MAG TPA: prepilin-type N-terminal cleavage/methylation domain-containing protein [Terriglobia bacterium]|nr:prepilin-type N-terminal cleavage/methylation domain-containing protein [Terriglobia bacterium]